MRKIRNSFHALNHDRLLRDPFVCVLPYDALGLLMKLHCIVGSTVRGYESGYLCYEDGPRLTVSDLLYLLSRGNSDQEPPIHKNLKLLMHCRQLKCSKPDLKGDGHLKLCFWQSDLEEAANEF